MANVPETPDYPAGIYQLETSDPVLGGAGGIANRQAEQLANRTAWLKAKIDAFIDGTVAVLKATKLATARTLSVSGAASGSASFDGSANANIALTLADSGAVAGTYPKVTINAKGLVTGGAALAAGDIPSLDWSKINSGKPTTLGGYGITDAQPLDATLTALAAQVTAANQMIYSTGVDSFGMTALTAFARTLLDDADAAAALATLGAAPLASPALTGTPTAPTAAAGTNTTQVATTAFVAAVKTLLDAAIALKAPLASPGLTGTPTAPTAAVGNNSTQVATTAFVNAEIANDAYLKTDFSDRVTSKGGNANGSYRVWASGRKDMIIGALPLTAPSVTLTLPIALASTIGANVRATVLGGAGAGGVLSVEVLSTTQIKVYCSQNCNVMVELNGDIA